MTIAADVSQLETEAAVAASAAVTAEAAAADAERAAAMLAAQVEHNAAVEIAEHVVAVKTAEEEIEWLKQEIARLASLLSTMETAFLKVESLEQRLTELTSLIPRPQPPLPENAVDLPVVEVVENPQVVPEKPKRHKML